MENHPRASDTADLLYAPEADPVNGKSEQVVGDSSAVTTGASGEYDDEDQMAFAAHAAAEALSENDHVANHTPGTTLVTAEGGAGETVAASGPGDNDVDMEAHVDMEALEKAVQEEEIGSAAEGGSGGGGSASYSDTIAASLDVGRINASTGHSQAPSPSLEVVRDAVIAPPPPPPPTIQPPPPPPLLQPPPTLAPPPELTHPICRICGQGNEEGRPILRFLPVHHDVAAANAAPSVVTFPEDLCLHIFCGKTASILPTVNRPDLEILTKAGLKNKHGIGPEVNAALARTRSAVLLHPSKTTTSTTSAGNAASKDAASGNGAPPAPVSVAIASAAAASSKEKQYYLVREFEAHLAAIRHTHITFSTDTNEALSQQHHHTHQQQQQQTQPPSVALPPPAALTATDPFSGMAQGELAALGDAYDASVVGDVPMEYAAATLAAAGNEAAAVAAAGNSTSAKTIPIKANAGQLQKPKVGKYNGHAATAQHPPSQPPPSTLPANVLLEQSHPPPPQDAMIPYGAEVQPDGRIKCPCGGTHLHPTQAQRGAQSWRNHIMTRRHQKWMEEQGLVGAV